MESAELRVKNRSPSLNSMKTEVYIDYRARMHDVACPRAHALHLDVLS